MTEAAPIGPIFERGPFHRLVAVFGGAGKHAIARAAIGLAVVAWLPLLLLAPLAAGAAGSPGQQARDVLTDYAALARYLVALPLLIVADRIVGARLTEIARHFVESGLVPAESQAGSTRCWPRRVPGALRDGRRSSSPGSSACWSPRSTRRCRPSSSRPGVAGRKAGR
jgi:hypothetical protein